MTTRRSWQASCARHSGCAGTFAAKVEGLGFREVLVPTVRIVVIFGPIAEEHKTS